MSSIELLRIFSMLMVLVSHANFSAFGMPTMEGYSDNSLFVHGQYFVGSLTIGCVNIFVLISGWFGIHPRKKSLATFLFQVYFFLFVIFLGNLILGFTQIDSQGILRGLVSCAFMYKTYWFVKAYLVLYLLAPVLNIFIEKASKRTVAIFLIAFYFFQTTYVWIVNSVDFFMNGFSTISFIGLYVLARYVRLYPTKLTSMPKSFDLMIFISCVLVISILSSTGIILADNVHGIFYHVPGKLLSYTNPLVIIMSLYLLLFASKFNFKSRFVNKVAASCFGVYLFQEHFCIRQVFYHKYIQELAFIYDGLYFITLVLLFICITFFISIIFDQIRINLWNKIIRIPVIGKVLNS